MVRVKLLCPRVDAVKSYMPGSIIEVSDGEAVRLVDSQQAEWVDGPPVKVADLETVEVELVKEKPAPAKTKRQKFG